MAQKKLHLESLRGVAALSVAVYHLKTGSFLENGFTDNAYLCVDFFFVLSGYVIALNYVPRLHRVQDALTFQKRRFWRLYPLHLATLIAFLGIEIAKFAFESVTQISARNPAFTTNDGWSFLQNLLLLQSVFAKTLTWNFPSWSISAEFLTYALFALLILVAGILRVNRQLIYTLPVVLGGIVVAREGLGSPEIGLFRCFLSFFIGCWAFEVEQRAKLSEGAVPGAVALAAIGVAVLVVVWSDALLRLATLAIPPLFAAVILVTNAADPQSYVMRALAHPWLVYLGTISYSIYMIHAALWWVLKTGLRFGAGVPVITDDEGKTIVAFTDPWIATGVSVMALVLLVGFAHVTYRLIERTFLSGPSGVALRREPK